MTSVSVLVREAGPFGLELAAQLEEVVDLAVVDDDVAPVGRGHRLMARGLRSRMARRRWPSRHSGSS